MDDAWLENLKPGDKVAVCSHFHGTTLAKVDRVTRTQIVVGGVKYRKSNGRACGDHGYAPLRICNPSEPWVANEIELGRRKDLRLKIQKAAELCEDTATLHSALAMLCKEPTK